MSIAHQMRAQRQIAAQEKKSLWLGSTILGCGVLAVVAAVALVAVNRGAAKDQDELAEGSAEQFAVTSAIGPVKRRGGAAGMNDDALLANCDHQMAVAGMMMSLSNAPRTEKFEESRRKIMSGEVCDQMSNALKTFSKVRRQLDGDDD